MKAWNALWITARPNQIISLEKFLLDLILSWNRQSWLTHTTPHHIIQSIHHFQQCSVTCCMFFCSRLQRACSSMHNIIILSYRCDLLSPPMISLTYWRVWVNWISLWPRGMDFPIHPFSAVYGPEHNICILLLQNHFLQQNILQISLILISTLVHHNLCHIFLFQPLPWSRVSWSLISCDLSLHQKHYQKIFEQSDMNWH